MPSWSVSARTADGLLTVKSPNSGQDGGRPEGDHPIIVVDSTEGRWCGHTRKGPDASSTAHAPGRWSHQNTDVIVTGDATVDLAALLQSTAGVRRLMVGERDLIWALFEGSSMNSDIHRHMIIGGADAPTPADGAGFLREADFVRLQMIEAEQIDGGLLIRWSVEAEGGGRERPGA